MVHTVAYAANKKRIVRIIPRWAENVLHLYGSGTRVKSAANARLPSRHLIDEASASVSDVPAQVPTASRSNSAFGWVMHSLKCEKEKAPKRLPDRSGAGVAAYLLGNLLQPGITAMTPIRLRCLQPDPHGWLHVSCFGRKA